ncbi:MAG: Ppx/GppA family phosphatase [Pirellulales bacterium]|nr:Ppx/GppA family phosphatase [Pirellulales bacterium]
MEQKPTSPAAEVVAVIDIGANAIRMALAEVFGDGRIEVLERLQRAARLGQDTFRRGRLGGESMRAGLRVLRDFRQVVELYQARRIRAVATSAVREASNADIFLDRIFLSTGFHVEVIDTSEECRLTVSAVRQALGPRLGGDHRRTLIADVGGGSTLLTLLENGEIAASQSLRLGSIRLQEMFSTSEESPRRSADLLRQHISTALDNLQMPVPLAEIETFVAVGGDARFAGRAIGQPAESADLAIIQSADFDGFVDRCERYTPEELSKRHGLPFAETETLNPALLVLQILLHALQADDMLVSQASMRDGLLLELAREVTGQEDEDLLQGIIHSATSIAEKYRVDMNHARNVTEVAIRLFDLLQADHALSKRHRLLLRVAGLLHEVGRYVSNRAHHKHSEYLIGNAEIFGLNRNEINLIAQIARYHRRSIPRAQHPNFTALRREERVVVGKLSALLRVADALIRGHHRRVQEIRLERRGDELLLALPGSNRLLEERALAAKGDLFEEIFGLKIRLEEE